MQDLLGAPFVLDFLREHAENKPGFSDNFNESRPGHFLGLDKRNKVSAKLKPLLRERLCVDKAFHSQTEGGGECWDGGKTGRFVEVADKAMELLFFLLQTSTGQPSRIPQLAFMLYRNSRACRRSVYARAQGLFLVGQWDKARDLQSGRSPGVTFLPVEVSNLLALYLLYVRPLYEAAWEQLRSNQEDGGDVCGDRLFMLLRQGRRVSPDHLRSVFRLLTATYFGVPGLGVQAWRQVNKLIVRKRCLALEHLSRDMIDDDSLEGEFAIMAGHSLVTALKRYGVSSEDMRSLTPERLDRIAMAAGEYHRFLRLRPCMVKMELLTATAPMQPRPVPADEATATLRELQCETEKLRALLKELSLQAHGRASSTPTSAPVSASRPAICPPMAMDVAASCLRLLREEVGEAQSFRTCNQAYLLQELLYGQDDVGILRVGGGKSTLLNIVGKVGL
jgi:hypothetical protein